MSAVAGYAVSVKLTGTSTAMTDAATTALSATRYQVTDSTKRVLDPAVAVTVEVDGAPATATDYTLDYLFGIVTFGVDPDGVVTVTANYLPLLTVALARSVSVSMSRVELDDSQLGSGEKSLKLGKKQAEAELQQLELLDADLDAGGATVTWDALHDAATPKLLEVDLSARKWRGWVVLSGLEQAASADELATATIRAKGSARAALGRSEVVSHAFGT
jgi:hypothetical protein